MHISNETKTPTVRPLPRKPHVTPPVRPLTWKPQPSGLTRDEIRAIVIETIG